MAEAGVDIFGHRSKHVRELSDVPFDYVVTVCGNAQESCPVFPGQTKVVHVGFDDPPRLAKEARTEEEALDHYRRVRDEIRKFVETLPESLTAVRPRAKVLSVRTTCSRTAPFDGLILSMNPSVVTLERSTRPIRGDTMSDVPSTHRPARAGGSRSWIGS